MEDSRFEHLKKRYARRFFEVEGASFLFCSIYTEVYEDLGIIAVNNGHQVSIYLNPDGCERSKREGTAFFSDESRALKYFEDFGRFLSEADRIFETLLMSEIASEECSRFIGLVFEFFSHYRKTESFYTDGVYADFSANPSEWLKIAIARLESIKTDGRELLIRIFNGKDSYLNRFIAILGKTYGYPEKLSRYSIRELPLLPLGLSVSDDRLLERESDYLSASSGEERIFLKGEAFERIGKTYAHAPTGIIQGVTASKGNIVGVARVLDANFNTFDHLLSIIGEMEEGEILVTETTSPDLILACRKASAIITNQGGMGSHAAIISREMMIPCIVGTGNATKMIKTGDRIRMDGDNGTVTILH